jgi:L-amino acid N-acyltransferase YncA
MIVKPQPTALHVRDAVVDDAEQIVGILNPIIDARAYTVFDRAFTIDAERQYLATFPARGVWKVAEKSDGRIVGFQVLEPYATYTGAFEHVGTLGTYVELGERRRGVARTLFAATFEAARRKGYEKISTLVRSDNPAALATYLVHGFTVVGIARKHAKLDGRYIDEVLIETQLDAHAGRGATPMESPTAPRSR